MKDKLIHLFFTKFSKFNYFRKAGACRDEWFAYNYLKRYIDWKDSEWSELDQNSVFPNDIITNKTIFVYWRQGFEQAPDIVQKCAKSVKVHTGEYKVMFLTEDNINDFVKLPKHIVDKHKRGIIKEAHYSDLIRTALLYHYGGIWCDATCFLTTNIDSCVASSDLFFFKSVILNRLSPIECSNWFIKAQKGNLVLRKVLNYLFKWYEKYDFIPNYYIYHLVLSLIVNEDKECRKIWEKVPYINNMNPHTFFFHFDKEYDEVNYHNLINSCFVQKLTYKYDSKLLKADKENMLMHFMKQ